MYSNRLQESLSKPLIGIIRVMQNIGFTTSPDINTMTPEKIKATIDQISC